LPSSDLPAVADLAVVDDGSATLGEVLNLLARRNLLFAVLRPPARGYRLTVDFSNPEWSRDSAADPSAFALRVRRALTDEERSLRLYGSEVVIGRLCGEGDRMRLHLLNYGGRAVENLRVKVRGRWSRAEGQAFGAGPQTLEERSLADDATEFTLTVPGAYAVVDLRR